MIRRESAVVDVVDEAEDGVVEVVAEAGPAPVVEGATVVDVDVEVVEEEVVEEVEVVDDVELEVVAAPRARIS